jgi:hypothetical protein
MTEPYESTVPPTPPSVVSSTVERWPAVYTLIGLYLLGEALMQVWQAYALLRGLGGALPAWFVMSVVPVLPLLLEVPAAMALLLRKEWGCRLGMAAAGARMLALLVLQVKALITMLPSTGWPSGFMKAVTVAAIALGAVGTVVIYTTIIALLARPAHTVPESRPAWGGLPPVVVFIAVVLLGRGMSEVLYFAMPFLMLFHTGYASQLVFARISQPFVWPLVLLMALAVPAQIAGGVALLRGGRMACWAALGILGMLAGIVLFRQGVAFWSMHQLMVMDPKAAMFYNLSDMLPQTILQLAGTLLQYVAMIVFLLCDRKAQHA